MAIPFAPAPDDSAIVMLRSIFGPVMDQLVGNSTATGATANATMLATAFEYYNSGVLFFGAFLLSWITVFGVANTANDGEALGKKWSTYWTPIRTLSATALLVPGAAGYSGIQILVLTIVTWSIGLASGMWTSVVDKVVNQGLVSQAVSISVTDASFKQAIDAALRMQTCALANNKALAATTPAGQTPPVLTVEPIQQTTKEAGRDVYHLKIHYTSPAWKPAENICGSMSWTNAGPVSLPTEDNVGSLYLGAGAFNSNSRGTQALSDELANQISHVRLTYFVQLFAPGGAIEQMARRIIEVTDSDIPDDKIDSEGLANLIFDYQKEMETKISQIVAETTKNNSTITSALSQGGWIWAGSWDQELSRMKDTIKSSSSNRIAYTPFSTVSSVLPGTTGEVAQQMADRYMKVAAIISNKAADKLQQKTLETTPPALTGNFSASDFQSGEGGVKERIENYFNSSVGNFIIKWTVTHLGENSADPVMQIKNYGDMLATVGETIITTKIAVNSGLFTAETAADESGKSAIGAVVQATGITAFVQTAIKSTRFVLNELWDYVKMPTYILMYGGFYMGIWIPMIPYVVFAIGVAGWIITVIEAVAASSLWAVMHVTPESNDSFIGGQQQGYLLLMSVFFRPPLMILGLVASMAAIIPIIQFINWSFVLRFQVLQTDSVTGIFSIAGYVVVYVFMVSSVLMMIFAMPQSMPDRILRWISAGTGDMGEQNTMGKIESGASHASRAALLAGMNYADKSTQAKKQKDLVDAQNAEAGQEETIRNQLLSEVTGQAGQSTLTANAETTPEGGPLSSSGDESGGGASLGKGTDQSSADTPSVGNNVVSQGGQSSVTSADDTGPAADSSAVQGGNHGGNVAATGPEIPQVEEPKQGRSSTPGPDKEG